MHARITHVKRGGRRHCHVGSAASDEQVVMKSNAASMSTRHDGK